MAEILETRCKELTIFLLVDASSIMGWSNKLDKVNRAIEEMIVSLKIELKEINDVEFKLAILDMSSGCRWVTDGPELLDDFVWTDLCASGFLTMGAAYCELDTKLSRFQYLSSEVGQYAPIIAMLVGTDSDDDWKFGLEKLRHNKWYMHATKVGFLMNDCCEELVKAFAEEPNMAIKVDIERKDFGKVLTRTMLMAFFEPMAIGNDRVYDDKYCNSMEAVNESDIMWPEEW